MAAKKNIMREFALDEISAVTQPAQKGARMLIMKRDEPPVEKDAEAVIAEAFKSGDDPATTTTEDDIGKELGMTPEQANELLALAGMNDAQKDHYGKLDAAGKAEFVKLDHAGRQAAVAAAVAKAAAGTGDDPVVYTTAAGVEIRKSHGDVLLSLAKQNDTLTNALAATKETALAAEAETLAKSWTHIGKPHEEKVAMAKGILELPAAQKDAALAAINVGKDSMAPIFKNLGALGGGAMVSNSGPVAKLDELAKARATKDSISYAKAYDEVIQTPEGKTLYEESLAQAH